MDNTRLETLFTSRTSILPLKPNIAQIFDYLGLSILQKDETQLIERINEDNMPVRLNLSENSLVHNCLVTLIELHEEPYLKFDSKRKFNRDNTYKINQIIDDASQKKIDVSSNNIIITTKNMYATKAEISEYYRNDLQLDNPSKDRTKPITNTKDEQSTSAKAKPKKEPIIVTRVRLFNQVSKQIARENNLPDDKNQTVYDSIQPPMTQKDYFYFIGKGHPKVFNANHQDFFRGNRVGVKFSKAGRHRK
jgi:hypothetical protein